MGQQTSWKWWEQKHKMVNVVNIWHGQNTVNITLRWIGKSYSSFRQGIKPLLPTSSRPNRLNKVSVWDYRSHAETNPPVLHMLLRIKVSSDVLVIKRPCPSATNIQIYSSQYFQKYWKDTGRIPTKPSVSIKPDWVSMFLITIAPVRNQEYAFVSVLITTVRRRRG